MSDKMIRGLSEHLIPVYEQEIAQGNEVVRVDRDAWTECPLAVIFRLPLFTRGSALEASLPPTVEYWECRDPHYEIQAGYACRQARHSVAGPLE